MPHQRLLLSVLLVLALLTPSAILAQPAASPAADALSTLAASTFFVENAGQWPDAARFQVWGGPGAMWLAEDAIWITLLDGPVPAPDLAGGDHPHWPDRDQQGVKPEASEAVHGVNLKLTFPGASSPALEPSTPVATKVSYFLGNDPAQWRPDVPVWGQVRYDDLYPGVDLVLGSDLSGSLAWSLKAQPGMEASPVHLRVEGADSVTLDGRLLHVATAAGQIDLPLPASDVPLLVDAPIGGNDAGLVELEPDRPRLAAGKPLNDPADLLYGTFLGGGQNTDQAYGVSVDSAGRAYITGQTWSNDFPTTPGVFDPTFNGAYDVFVTRLNADGRSLSYSTFLGGYGGDQGNAIDVDTTGQATLAGETSSPDFPTTPGAFDPTQNGETDGFVARLNDAGTALLLGTYLGGTQSDYAWDVSLDPDGKPLVAGETYSANFPTTAGAFDTSYNGNWDGFVARLNGDGTALDWSTFLGANDHDNATAVVLDASGRPAVTGTTASSTFPVTPGALDTTYNGYDDAYVLWLDDTGSALIYATFLGGSETDWGGEIARALSNRVCITGGTYSVDFPTAPQAFDPTANGYTDAYLVCIATTDTTLRIGTYLGGGSYDGGAQIRVDSSGHLYVAGSTSSASFPITADAFDTTHNGGTNDGFLVRLSADARSLSYGTFLGGSDEDRGNAVALDAALRAYLVGTVFSADFPTTPEAFDTTYNGAGDAFAVRLVLGNAADLDGDGEVTVLDLSIIAAAWGQAGVFDLDGDGVVTIVDIMIVASNWEGAA